MKKKKKINEHTISNKVKTIHLVFSFFAILLVLFAFRWQVIGASKFDLLAKSRFQNQTLTSMRGSIFSKDGTTLAYTELRVKVSIWLPDLIFYEKDLKSQTREELIEKVAPIIGIGKLNLQKR